MTTRRRQRFVHAQVAWMLAGVLVLTLTRELTARTFFAASFVGFLVVLEATRPYNLTPGWRKRIRVVAFVGLVVIGYVIVTAILALLPPGLV